MTRDTIRRAARLAFWAAAAVAYVSAVVPHGPSIAGNDKTNHMLAFGTLAVLGRLGWSRARAMGIALALIGFGALIELSQALPLVGRDASWADLLADIVAVALGMLAGTLLLRLSRRGRPPA